ncbi:MAG: hypothetical protein DMD87_14625 [Candidatus Rokuibacteriota bacterium]|nr:MAG: hypothetical protein DMD87_14625 [Candidatus Rokubacteria bacterium]
MPSCSVSPSPPRRRPPWRKGSARRTEGQNVTIEARFADGHTDRLAALTMDLVRLDVHVIVAGPSTVAQAARQATATIPIVMAGVGEPEPSGRQHDGTRESPAGARGQA